jgi:hypothetical protein
VSLLLLTLLPFIAKAGFFQMYVLDARNHLLLKLVLQYTAYTNHQMGMATKQKLFELQNLMSRSCHIQISTAVNTSSKHAYLYHLKTVYDIGHLIFLPKLVSFGILIMIATFACVPRAESVCSTLHDYN